MKKNIDMAARSRRNHSGKVLLAHALPGMAKQMQDALSGLNLSIVTSTDGKEAMDWALEENFFLLILDASLPRFNGFEICRTIKESMGSKGPRVFLIVDRDDLHGREKAFLSGCDGIITGPPQKDALLSQVMELFASPSPLSQLMEDIQGGFGDPGDGKDASSTRFHWIDKETGLYTETFFLEKAQEEFKRARRHNRPLCLIFLEPLFKEGGEGTYGKEAILGIIRELSGRFLLEFRSEDLLGISRNFRRFLLLFPETFLQGARKIWERILAFTKDMGLFEEITFKGGASLYPALSIQTDKGLLSRCEECLKKAFGHPGSHMEFMEVPEEPPLSAPPTKKEIELPPTGPVLSRLQEESLRLKSILLSHNPSLEKHLERVEKWAILLGEELGFAGRDAERIAALSRVFDLGWIGIPRDFFEKVFLSDEEFELVKSHVELGARMAGAFFKDKGFELALRSHHENYDGSGYPLGLRGGEIPPFSQIIHLTSFFSRLVEGNAFRPPLSKESVSRILQWKASHLFDPRLVAVFLTILGKSEPEESIPPKNQHLILLEGLEHLRGGEVYFDGKSNRFLYYHPPLKPAEKNLSLVLKGNPALSIREMANRINQSKKGLSVDLSESFLSAEKTAVLIASLGWRAVPHEEGFVLETLKNRGG